MRIENKQGQGMIELIIAIAVITVGLFAAWTLFLSNFNSEQEAKARVIGANLAREGIEAVKNIRDSNWLYKDENIYDGDNLWDFDHGLGDGSYIVGNLYDYEQDGEAMITLEEISEEEVDKSKLYYDTNGFMTHENEGGEKYSGYSRIIIIRNICCQVLENDETKVFLKQCKDQDFRIIENGECDAGSAKIGIDVQSQVKWLLEGKPRSVLIQEQLFDWK